MLLLVFNSGITGCARLIITSGDLRSFYPQSVVSIDLAKTILHKPVARLFFYYIVFYNSIMSAPSTTNYKPFDSEAPNIFRTIQTDNYLKGE